MPGTPLAPGRSGLEAPGPGLAARGRPAIPGASPAAPTFEDEVRTAVRYEKGLAVKALVAIALVAVVLTLRFLFLG